MMMNFWTGSRVCHILRVFQDVLLPPRSPGIFDGRVLITGSKIRLRKKIKGVARTCLQNRYLKDWLSESVRILVNRN
jgi:hypothetical protein